MKTLRYLLLVSALFFALKSPCQFLPDSLMASYESLPDSSKVKYINDFVHKNYRSQPILCQSAIDQAIDIASRIQDKGLKSQSYSLAGVLAKNSGDFATALELHLKSLYINKQINDKRAQASNYNDIGIVYKNLKEYDKALESYRMANSLSVELELKRGIIMTLNNIGTIYEAKHDYNAAIDYYNRAYKEAVRFQMDDAQAVVLNNLGDIYATKGDPIMARDYFRQTLAIDERSGDHFGKVYSLVNIAGTMVGTSEFDSALVYYDRALSLAKDLYANQQLFEIYNSLSQLYEAKHDYKQALKNFRTAIVYRDSLSNENKQRQMAEAEARFEAKQKDNEIQLLKQEKLIKEFEIQQHKSEIMALISTIVIGSLVIIFLYKRHQAKQQQKFNSNMLAQKEVYLKAVVEAQEDERKRIASDLHDSVGQNLTAVKLGLSSIMVTCSNQPSLSTKFEDLAQTLNSTIQEVRNISHQMMPRMLQEDGLVPAIADMLEKTFRHTQFSYNFEHFGLESRLDEKIEIGLFRIVQELINNIIKHSEATQVSVQLLRNAQMLILLVEDNGKGFALSSDKKAGIGLLNISSRVETIHGEFNLEPSPNSGTLATIRIPINKSVP